MDIAKVVSTRSTCPRASVGAVFTRDNQILVTGYNGSLPGREHCSDFGCQMEAGHCLRTIHAEENAILQAARIGVSVEGAVVYIFKDRGNPNACFRCRRMMSALKIAHVYIKED